MTIALPYKRVSSDEQGKEGLSLATQDKEDLRYIDQRGFYLGPQFADVLTGMRDDRPGYQALLLEVRRLRQAREAVVVVVFRSDRFGRDTEERARAWKELTKLGVKIHSVTEGGEMTEEVFLALGFAAHVQIIAMRNNIQRTLRNAHESGWWTSGRCPYGYRWRKRTDDERARGAPRGVLDEEPVQAARVKEAFQRLADGESATKVHRWLTSLPEAERGGRTMHRRSVFLMFKAPLYMARFEDGAAGNWPALVAEETWHKAQRTFLGRSAGQRAARGHYLLSGFLRCSKCTHSMVGTSVGTSSRQQRRYRCKAREHGSTCSETVSVTKVEQEVLTQLANLLDWLVDPEKRTQLRQQWDLRRTKVTSNSDREQRQLQRDIDQDRTRLYQAMDKWNDGKMTDDEYYGYRGVVEQRIKANTERLNELATAEPSAPELPPLDDLLGPAPAWHALLLGSDDIEALRRVLSVFVSSVVAHRTSWGRYDIEVGFTELGNSLMVLMPPGLEQAG